MHVERNINEMIYKPNVFGISQLSKMMIMCQLYFRFSNTRLVILWINVVIHM